jgi:hypothetical protein
MEPHVTAIATAIDNAKAANVSDVFCGRAVPSKFRKHVVS